MPTMASTASMPRALAHLSSAHPLRSSTMLPLRRHTPQQLLVPGRRTYASKPSKDTKPPVLEKPDQFRPPSHPAKLPSRRAKPKYEYGPRLTPADVAAQRTKKYPNMMPPEGSFMHWFLSNRMLHVYIAFVSSTFLLRPTKKKKKTNAFPTQSVLFTLAGYTFWMNFLTTTPYRDLLPSRGELLTHPFRSISTAASVYRMHAEHVSAETAERRKRKVDDVDKRAEYRRAHGLEDAEGEAKGAWFGGERVKGAAAEVDVQSPVAPAVTVQGEGEEAEFRDFEGRPQRRPVKKWLGIW